MTPEELDNCTHITNPSTHIQTQFRRSVRYRSRGAVPDIDFDEASAAWMENKVRKGYMIYYRCATIQKNGKQCAKAVTEQTFTQCKQHRSSPGGRAGARLLSSPVSSPLPLTTQ